MIFCANFNIIINKYHRFSVIQLHWVFASCTDVTSIWNVSTTSIFVSCASTSPPSASPVNLFASDPCDLKHSCLLNLGLGSGPAFDLITIKQPFQITTTKGFEQKEHPTQISQIIFNYKHMGIINVIELYVLGVRNGISTVIEVKGGSLHSQARWNAWWHTIWEPITDTKDD